MFYNLLLGRPWIHGNWIIPFILHQCFKYVDDKAMVRTLFTETQPFKRVKSYFTDSLLYQETRKVRKELLPYDIGSGNEANSESEEDTLVTFAMEPLVAYLDDPYFNNSIENDSEWSLNEDIDFDYSLWFYDSNSANTSSFHMPIPTLMTECMHIEDDDGSVFFIPSSKKGQSLIIFDRMLPWIATLVDSNENLDPP